jgi:osmoprotectant transport system ATP-binding protein
MMRRDETEQSKSGIVPDFLEVSHLTKKYGDLTAVDDVTFTVPKGETFVLLGSSGCGKTTLLKTINRLIEPTSGTILIEGRSTADIDPEELRRGMGYVIQDIGLFPHYTTARNIAVVPELLGWDMPRVRQRVDEMLHQVGLDPAEFADRFPRELSGGQQQRIGLARAFAADPEIVLLDEPFGALDPITRREIQREFKNLETLLNKTLILVTHDVFEAFDLGDRVCLMDKGRIKQIGYARDLLFSPVDEFVSRFFQASRLLLELKVFSLHDLLPYLKGRPASTREEPRFSERERVLDVLEALEREKCGRGTFVITDVCDEPVAASDAWGILSAFYALKSEITS